MRKFENTVIVTDLDGTFLGKDASLVEENLRAVKYFKENGGNFTVATGRVPQHVLEAVPMVSELVNMPAITNNGGCLYDFARNEVVKMYSAPFDDIKGVVETVHREFPEACVRSASIEYGFMTTEHALPNKYMVYDFTKNVNITKLVSDVDEWKKYDLLKIAVRCPAELVSTILDTLEKRFGETLCPVQSGSTTIDVMGKGINKGAMLGELMSDSRYAGKSLYACGDHTNDLEMLALADVSVCPSGAHERVREASDLCLCSNDEGVIAALIEHIEKNQNK